MTGLQDETFDRPSSEWSGDVLKKEELEAVDVLTESVRKLMAHDIDSLMSMLYRLDVEEQKVRDALSPSHSGDPARLLAMLIIDRQKRRMATREKHGPDPSLNWIDV